MDVNEYTNQMNRTGLVTGKEVTNPMLNAYWEAIEKYDEALFCKAMEKIRNEEQTFPSLSKIRSVYAGLNSARQAVIPTPTRQQPRRITNKQPIKASRFVDMLLRKYPYMLDDFEIEDANETQN